MKHKGFRSSHGGAGLLLLALVALALPAGLAWGQQAPGAPGPIKKMTEEDLAKIPGGDQPIKFSHRVHATDNNIQCEYCHIYARRSQVSGAPPVYICMGCHKYVATELSEVKKLTEYWNKQEPIPWVKKHDIPDFARYPHYRHVRAKDEVYPNGIQCQDCHGPIETMDVVEKVTPDFGLMGWCIKCHLTIPGTLERKRAMPAADGSNRLKAALRPNGQRRPNLTDCLTCHR